ncbi:MAG: hypothetical protein SH856_09000 [Flavobacteriales bacterium]|nr:hypothetical protein [Flavobacteriales bacterium]
MNQFKKVAPGRTPIKITHKNQKVFVVKLHGGYIKKYSAAKPLYLLELTQDSKEAQTFNMTDAMEISKKDHYAKVETVEK